MIIYLTQHVQKSYRKTPIALNIECIIRWIRPYFPALFFLLLLMQALLNTHEFHDEILNELNINTYLNFGADDVIKWCNLRFVSFLRVFLSCRKEACPSIYLYELVCKVDNHFWYFVSFSRPFHSFWRKCPCRSTLACALRNRL